MTKSYVDLKNHEARESLQKVKTLLDSFASKPADPAITEMGEEIARSYHEKKEIYSEMLRSMQSPDPDEGP